MQHNKKHRKPEAEANLDRKAREAREAHKARRRGVTLIEIAIVLVIIGILLGGVLKGQELINNARVRTLADDQHSMRVAWFAFLARYGGVPADYVFAAQHIRGAENGNGNGIIGMWESPKVFQQLAASGYIKCQQCNEKRGTEEPSTANSVLNPYGGVMAIFNNGYFGDDGTVAAVSYARNVVALVGTPLMIHSGGRIPSNIVTEVDLKIDDGIASSGEVVFNRWDVSGGSQTLPLSCMSLNRGDQSADPGLENANPIFYRHSSVSPEPNCGFSSYL